ncbi:MAG: type III pantothenate kinase [Burkholderiales bacterium]
MILTLDAGNTRIKWGLRHDGAWEGVGALPVAEAGTLAEALGCSHRPERILVANVAGAAVQAAIERASAQFGCLPEFIQACAQQCGVRSSYDDPAQLGADRWAALIAARRLFGGPCLAVNAGTALTVDALSDEGVFLGGIIAPGIELMRRALDAYTAGLRMQPGEVRFFPANTGDAIMSGAAHAAAGATERMASFMQANGQSPVRVVLGGGAAPVLRPLLATLDTVEVDHLVLEGLAAIAEEGG